MHEAWGAWSFGWIAPSTDRDTTTQDAFNRDVGIAIGNEVPDGDLYQPCFDAMVAGRLDLTAAGVARGRAPAPLASRRRSAQPPRERLQVLDELGRLVDLELDAEHRDPGGQPVEVVVAGAVLAAVLAERLERARSTAACACASPPPRRAA